jgi:hypothetical protein
MSLHNARLTEQIFDGGFCAFFAQKVTAEICPVEPFVICFSHQVQ